MEHARGQLYRQDLVLASILQLQKTRTIPLLLDVTLTGMRAAEWQLRSGHVTCPKSVSACSKKSEPKNVMSSRRQTTRVSECTGI